jgi:hypothetical protein
LTVQGLPLPISIAIASGVLLLASRLAKRRPGFAPLALREEALVVLLAVALVVSLAEGVGTGWGSALALNADPAAFEASPGAGLSSWIVGVMLASGVLGAVYSMWMRR